MVRWQQPVVTHPSTDPAPICLTCVTIWCRTPTTHRTLSVLTTHLIICCLFELQCIQIVERIQRLSLAREEYFILKALILTNSDVRLDEPQALYRFRDSILNSLSDCVAAVRPAQALRATQNMFLILPSLRQADGIVRKFWSSVYRTGKVPMNKLFVEMLEAACYRWWDLIGNNIIDETAIAHALIETGDTSRKMPLRQGTLMDTIVREKCQYAVN